MSIIASLVSFVHPSRAEAINIGQYLAWFPAFRTIRLKAGGKLLVFHSPCHQVALLTDATAHVQRTLQAHLRETSINLALV